MQRLNKAIFIFIAFWLFSPQFSYACDCTYAGNFKEFSSGQTVIQGKVKSYGAKLSHGETLYSTMIVSVTELIKGSYNHSSVIFEGDPGHLCLTYVDSDLYPINSEHLFVLFSEENKQGLAGCGEVSVSVIKGRVHGTKPFVD